MIIYVVHPEKATKKLLRLISELAKLPDTRLICKNGLFLHTRNEQSKTEF